MYQVFMVSRDRDATSGLARLLDGAGACTNASVESPFGAALEPKACECARVDAAVTDIAIALENQNINVQPDEARI